MRSVFFLFAVLVWRPTSALALATEAAAGESRPIGDAKSEAPPKSDVEKAVERTRETVSEAAEKAASFLKATRARRENASFYVLGNYSVVDMLIPGKYGATAGLVRSADQTWELEYLRGSVSLPYVLEDLGQMTDERFVAIGRSYFGSNSFNLSYGLAYSRFSIHLGNQILSRVSGGTYPSLDLVEIQSLGFNVGVGNRWIFGRDVTFGVDWISWTQPVVVIGRKSEFLNYASNQSDKDKVDTALSVISYLPRLAILKLQLGVAF